MRSRKSWKANTAAEDELLEIVEQFVKLTPESAKWEENMQGIKYKYQEECA